MSQIIETDKRLAGNPLAVGGMMNTVGLVINHPVPCALCPCLVPVPYALCYVACALCWCKASPTIQVVSDKESALRKGKKTKKMIRVAGGQVKAHAPLSPGT